MAHLTEAGNPVNLTGTAAVTTASCVLLGFYVNSTTSGTLVLRVGGSGGTALGTITPAVGFHRYPLSCPGGLHATIANTLDVTFLIQSGIC